MKRLFTYAVLLALNILVASHALAGGGYCEVSVKTDNDSTDSLKSSDDSDFALRTYIEEEVNKRGEDSTCTTYYTTGNSDSNDDRHELMDYEHFRQGIIFATPEYGGSVHVIQLKKPLKIDSYTSLVIGNWSTDMLIDPTNEVGDTENGVTEPYTDEDVAGDYYYYDGSDRDGDGYSDGLDDRRDFNFAGLDEYLGTEVDFTFYGYGPQEIIHLFNHSDWSAERGSTYNYGSVVIDGSALTEAPFQCDETIKDDGSMGNVYVRNMVILTAPDVDQFGDEGSTACIKNGGAVHVCSTDKYDADVYNDWLSAYETWYDNFQDNRGTDVGEAPKLSDDWCDNSDDNGHLNWADLITLPAFDFDTLCPEANRKTYYQDSDADGYGNPSVSTRRCQLPTGYVENADDCDDTSALAYTGATESCGDGIDNDCSGAADCSDNSCSTDSACVVSTETSCTDGSDNDGDGLIDCSDSDCASDSACTTAQTEICDDNINNDGDNAVDCEDSDCEFDPACDIDADGDGFSISEDCDDSDATINPDPTTVEICADGIDNNCDDIIDDANTCVNKSISEGEGGQNARGGACGCDLNAKQAPKNFEMFLSLVGMLPLAIAFALRQRAKSQESQV